MGEIRDTEIEIGQGLFGATQLVLNRLDPLADRLHGGHGSICRLFFPLQLGDVLRSLFQFGTKLLDLGGQGAALLDQRAQITPWDVGSAVAELFPGAV